MGSGHILCYMFDVLMQIYEDYGYTAREAAASIVEHNLYGLDIDDRAAQLAYFAVMMKARQYDRRFFSRGIQPHVMAIEESNGLRTWTEAAGDSLVAGQLTFEDDFIRMADTLIETFKDAKEYGSILTVRADHYDALADFIEKARQEAGNLLFRAWIDEVAQRILPLIQQATWLAAKYDIVVTNPPYMGGSNMSAKLSAFVKKHYTDTKSDLSTIFMEKTLAMCQDSGYMSMINIPVWMFLSSYEKLRLSILEHNTYSSMLHLGRGIFGSDFGTTAFVIAKRRIENYRGSYRRLFEKQVAVDSIEEKEQKFFSGKGAFVGVQENFAKIPGSPVAYWVSDKMLNCFSAGTRLGDIADSKQGLATGENDRFVRLWQEVDRERINFQAESNLDFAKSNRKWAPYNKGGEFRKWYGNNTHIVNWENDGKEIKSFTDSKGKLRSRPQNLMFYFRESFTWSLISSSVAAFRYKPHGHIFDIAGMSGFSRNNLLYLLALCNTKFSMKVLEIIAPTLNYQCGDIANIPIIIDEVHRAEIESLAQENISISRADWDSYETSWDFVRHPLLAHPAPTLAAAYEQHRAEANARFDRLKANEEELNRIFIDIYGLADELTSAVEERDVTVRRIFDTKEDIPASMRGSNYAITRADVVRSLISYAVGCMFGRYSLDTPGLAYAGGDWDGGRYTTFLPDEDGIIPICDNEYFDDDIVERFAAFLTAALGAEMLEENLHFVADAIGTGGSPREVIRSYFLTTFYADHVKTYQKRPIYWLFDSGKKNGFKCLVYMHRYDPDTLARIRTDYVHEQQSRYRTAISNLEDARDHAATAADRVSAGKKLASVIDREKELLAYEEKIHHIADQRLTIDLDDGVKHNYAIFQDVLAKIK